MPSYDFLCRDCHHSFTINLSISERKQAACENCGSANLEQLFRKCNVLGVSRSNSGGSARRTCSSSGCGSCSGC